MKRTILFVASLILVVGIGAAVAEDAADKSYNGITYFEPARVSSQTAGAASAGESGAMAYNGITYFGASETKQASSRAAGGSERGREPEKKPYNGITAF